MIKKVILCTGAMIALALTGCTATQLSPAAQKVIVSPNPQPKGCKYVGQVFGNQGNLFTGDFTSNRNLEEGSWDDLKNKAAKLNANYVQVITSRAGVTGSTDAEMSHHTAFFSESSEQTNVTTTGNAYRCPPAAIGE